MKTKPNILIINFDHQLFYRHGYDEGVRLLRPNFDRFCDSAEVFENAYSVSPLCSPARRSMLNGVYPHKHGEVRNGINLPVREETYYDVLMRQGYDCTYFGKWHAGKGNAQSELKVKGFSADGYGCPYQHEDYRQYLDRYNLPEPSAYIDISETQRELYQEGSTFNLCDVKNLWALTFGTLTTKKETHECFYLANRAVETLKESKTSDKPFCLRVDFWGPHQPYFPSQEFLDMYDGQEFLPYGSFDDDLSSKPPIYKYEAGFSLSKNKEIIYPNPVSKNKWQKMMKYAYAHNTMCDYAAGHILNALEELDLKKNTYVIWSADHGDGLGAHGGHIDKNCYLSEEVIRIPLAVRNPFNQKGKIRTDYVSNLDIPPTIADIAGDSFKSEIDGKTLLKNTDREYFVCTSHGHFQRHIARGVIHNSYRYIYNKDMIEELYDMILDPYQLVNLSNQKKYADIKAKLQGFLKEWKENFSDREI